MGVWSGRGELRSDGSNINDGDGDADDARRMVTTSIQHKREDGRSQ